MNDVSAGRSPRVSPSQRRAIATVANIVEAAHHLLETVGRDRLAISAVASRAGVSVGTVYRYFPDRVALLDHVWPDRSDTFLRTDLADG